MSPYAKRRCVASVHATCLAVMMILAAACAHRGVPAAYPAFDHAKAAPVLVVATLAATGELPAFPECASPDVLCMDPAPTWMKLRALETVFGTPMPDTFFASTTSHYGAIDDAGPVRKPMLMLLLTQDRETVMARYSRALLDQDSSGQLHLVLRNGGPHWLPCSVAGVREPITDPMLARAGAIAREHYLQFYADAEPDYFRVEGDRAFPRYSLPIAQLRAHLAERAPPAQDFACASTGG